MPSTVISLEHPDAALLVLRGSSPLITGARLHALRAFAGAVQRGHAGALVPGLAVLASSEPLPPEPLVGRIGVLGSEEVKRLRGWPLRHVDKVYTSATVAAAEADALEEVHGAWPELAPRLLERRGPFCNRTTWVDGRPLDLQSLDAVTGERRVLEAAGLLGRLHRRLGPAAPGQQLVHGDFWLGNLLLDDAGALVRVIDWTDATRGDADVDLRFLVDSWAQRCGLDPAATVRLGRDAEEAYRAGLEEPLSPA